MPQIMKQAVVESCMLGPCAYPGLTGNGVMNCTLVSSLSCAVKSHPFSHKHREVNGYMLSTNVSLMQC